MCGSLLFFADEVTASARAHAGGVGGSSGNVAAVSYGVGAGFAIHGQRHFAIEDYVSGETGVRVVWVKGVRTMLPHEGVRKALGFELFPEQGFV
jgi:hypothetical protein